MSRPQRNRLGLTDRKRLQLGYMLHATDDFSKGQLPFSFHHTFQELNDLDMPWGTES